MKKESLENFIYYLMYESKDKRVNKNENRRFNKRQKIKK